MISTALLILALAGAPKVDTVKVGGHTYLLEHPQRIDSPVTYIDSTFCDCKLTDACVLDTTVNGTDTLQFRYTTYYPDKPLRSKIRHIIFYCCDRAIDIENAVWYPPKIYHSLASVPKDTTKRWDVKVAYRYRPVLDTVCGEIVEVDSIKVHTRTVWRFIPDTSITEIRK